MTGPPQLRFHFRPNHISNLKSMPRNRLFNHHRHTNIYQILEIVAFSIKIKRTLFVQIIQNSTYISITLGFK
ncbi:hypothetical protein Hanom_Chr06g00532771 [Helianthus anomalus]